MDGIRHQERFATAIWKQLNHICRNGKLGHAEMMLLFAFRDEAGDIKSGWQDDRVLFIIHMLRVYEHSVSGHSKKNEIDIQDHFKDFKEHFALPWNEYANRVLPCKLTICMAYQLTYLTGNGNGTTVVKLSIQRDESSGLPLFPLIDAQKMIPEDVRQCCSEYFAALWGQST